MPLVALAACDRDPPGHQLAPRDPMPPRRVIEPPTGAVVRAMAPHAIFGDRVGPYLLDEKFSVLMQQLPSGPRVTRFEIPGLVQTSLLRTEEDRLVIGGETGGNARFIAILSPEVARTESNVHVGSSIDEVARELGPPIERLDLARDPRVAVMRALPNARLVLDGARVAAIVLAAPEAADRPSTVTPASECARPAATPTTFGICLTGVGELVEVSGDELSLRVGDARESRDAKMLPIQVPGLVFAAALRNPADGRDELVAVGRLDDPHQRTWTISAYRMEGRTLVRSVDPQPVFQVAGSQTRWIGATLTDVDLYLELTSRPEGIAVGGLLTTRAGSQVRDAVELVQALIPRAHPGKPSAPVGGTGSGSAGSGSAGMGSGSAGSGSAARVGSGSAADAAHERPKPPDAGPPG